MSGEPDIAIKNRLHHFQRIAAGTQVMRDDQRDESNHAGTSGTDTIAEQPLQHQAEHHRTPTDEDRGRVEIGDWWSALQIHAREHAERMHHQREHEQQEGGFTQATRTTEPRDAS